MVYGYARVSSQDQNEARQFIALRDVGVEKKYIYLDKQSGKDFDRPQYKKLLRKLKKNDLLYIKSIDRLGRNYKEILEQWRFLNKDRGVDIVVLDMPLLDTRRGKDLMGTLISDIVFQLLSFMAQTEREFIRQRQQEGISIAKANGVRFGRPPKERPPQYREVAGAYAFCEISAREAARRLGTTHKTFLRWFREEELTEGDKYNG